mmetsp:Transcript_12524/g.36402  ORF Transcript_12524/g.36402 Transcript_12524/m.36402 type:complete len:245 (+) Transcript_12524:438-1172(+)
MPFCRMDDLAACHAQRGLSIVRHIQDDALLFVVRTAKFLRDDTHTNIRDQPCLAVAASGVTVAIVIVNTVVSVSVIAASAFTLIRRWRRCRLSISFPLASVAITIPILIRRRLITSPSTRLAAGPIAVSLVAITFAITPSIIVSDFLLIFVASAAATVATGRLNLTWTIVVVGCLAFPFGFLRLRCGMLKWLLVKILSIQQFDASFLDLLGMFFILELHQNHVQSRHTLKFPYDSSSVAFSFAA